MATLSCTVNGFNNFTSSNTSGVWGSTSWYSPTAVIDNDPCFGKFYYGGNYKYRALVIKITTPTYPNGAHTRKLTISVPLRRTSQGTDNWHCAISTTAPSFTNRASAQIPSTWVTTWNDQITTSSTWATKTFGTANFEFQSNTTYYLWLYSDTPTGNYTTGFFCNNYGAGNITVSTSYSTRTSNTNYCLPTNPTLYGYQGYYHGAYVEIDENTDYPRCFVGTSPTGTFYRKSLTATTEGRQRFSVDPDTSSTTKTYYIVRMTEDYYTSLGKPSNMSAPPTAYQVSYQCPRYACQIYCHALEPTICTNLGGYSLAKFDGMTAKGLSTTETGTSVDLSFDWTANGVTLNGGTFYRIYTGTKSSTFYCGGSTARTASTDITFYGKDSTLVGNTTFSGNTTCESDTMYSLIGWTELPDSYVADYTDLGSAIADGSTIYGVYEREYGITIGMYSLYPDSEDCYKTYLQDTYARYYFGTGDYYVAFYEAFDEPSVIPNNWKLVGWKYVNSSTIYSWENLVDTTSKNSLPNIEIVIETDNHVMIGDSSWKNAKLYYGVNGEWKQIIVRYGVNNQWLGGTKKT